MADGKKGGGDRNKEMAFQYWYSDVAKKYGLPPDPKDPRQEYDYRAAFEEGNMRLGEGGELPAKYRTLMHPGRFRQTENGRWFDTAEDKLMPENVDSMLGWFQNRQRVNQMAQMQQQQQMQQRQGPPQAQGQPQGMGGGGDMKAKLMQAIQQKMAQGGGQPGQPTHNVARMREELAQDLERDKKPWPHEEPGTLLEKARMSHNRSQQQKGQSSALLDMLKKLGTQYR